MSILSSIDETMTEVDLFVINKQLSECMQKVSELTNELNDTRFELNNIKNNLSYLRRVNANLVRHFDIYCEKINNMQKELDYLKAITYD